MTKMSLGLFSSFLLIFMSFLSTKAFAISTDGAGTACRAEGMHGAICRTLADVNQERGKLVRFRLNGWTKQVEINRATDTTDKNWAGWERLTNVFPSVPEDLSVSMMYGGRISVFVVGTNHAIYHTMQTDPLGNEWKPWSRWTSKLCERPYANEVGLSSIPINESVPGVGLLVYTAYVGTTQIANTPDWYEDHKLILSGYIPDAQSGEERWTNILPIIPEKGRGLAKKLIRVSHNRIDYVGTNGKLYYVERGEDYKWTEHENNLGDANDVLLVTKTCNQNTTLETFQALMNTMDAPPLSTDHPLIQINFSYLMTLMTAVAGGRSNLPEGSDNYKKVRAAVIRFANQYEFGLSEQYEMGRSENERSLSNDFTELSISYRSSAPALYPAFKGNVTRYLAAMTQEDQGARSGANLIEIIAGWVLATYNPNLTDAQRREIKIMISNKLTPCLERNQRVGAIRERYWNYRHTVLADERFTTPGAFFAHSHLRGDLFMRFTLSSTFDALDNLTTSVLGRTGSGTSIAHKGRAFYIFNTIEHGAFATLDWVAMVPAASLVGRAAMAPITSAFERVGKLIRKPVLTEAEVATAKIDIQAAAATAKAGAEAEQAAILNRAQANPVFIDATLPPLELFSAAGAEIRIARTADELKDLVKQLQPDTVLEMVRLQVPSIANETVELWKVVPAAPKLVDGVVVNGLASLAQRLAGANIPVYVGTEAAFTKMAGASARGFFNPNLGLFLTSDGVKLTRFVAGAEITPGLLLGAVGAHELVHVARHAQACSLVLNGAQRANMQLINWTRHPLQGYESWMVLNEFETTLHSLRLEAQTLRTIFLNTPGALANFENLTAVLAQLTELRWGAMSFTELLGHVSNLIEQLRVLRTRIATATTLDQAGIKTSKILDVVEAGGGEFTRKEITIATSNIGVTSYFQGRFTLGVLPAGTTEAQILAALVKQLDGSMEALKQLSSAPNKTKLLEYENYLKEMKPVLENAREVARSGRGAGLSSEQIEAWRKQLETIEKGTKEIKDQFAKDMLKP